MYLLYLEGLHAVLKSTTRWVHFGFCSFSSSELQSIFIAAEQINELWLASCKLDVTGEFDVSQQTFHIEYLDLNGWGYASGWNNNIGLEILVKAVANSSLKYSLNGIWIRERWEDYEYKDKVKEIFERHYLQNVLKLEEI